MEVMHEILRAPTNRIPKEQSIGNDKLDTTGNQQQQNEKREVTKATRTGGTRSPAVAAETPRQGAQPSQPPTQIQKPLSMENEGPKQIKPIYINTTTHTPTNST